MGKLVPFLSGFGLAAVLFSLGPPSPRFAAAAPDNMLGMAILSAYVASTGALLGGSGATGANKVSLGQYRVQFDRIVSSCLPVATPRHEGQIHAQHDGGGAPNAVSVTTNDSAGDGADNSFYLIVYCPR